MKVKSGLLIALALVLSGCGSGDSEDVGNDNSVNTVPIANAGSDESISLGEQITLSGEQSSDADGDSLQFVWSIAQLPSASTLTLSTEQVGQASVVVTPDVVGNYVFELSVNDGTSNSNADQVTVTVTNSEAENTAPIASAGSDLTIEIGNTVSLTGAGSSDPEGDSLSYLWSLLSQPDGSGLQLASTNAVTLEFIPSVLGEYVLSLQVTDTSNLNHADSVTVTVVEATTSTADFYTPEPITEALQRSRNVVWTELQSDISNLQRFVMHSGVSVGVTETNGAVDEDIALMSGLLESSSATDDVLMNYMLQAQEIESGFYRLMSVKQPNFALDYDSSHGHFVWRDVRSEQRKQSSQGYILFEFNNASDKTITASKRYSYSTDSSDFAIDESWTSSQVTISDNMLTVGASSDVFSLYDAPIDFSIPEDFNPSLTQRVDNDEVTPESKGGDDKIAETPSKVVDKYSDQLANAGNDAETLAAASSMLDQIEASLASQSSSLRYPKSFYLAFREGLLSRVVTSSEATDSSLMQQTVPYVYFTNETDEDGIYHPFMVIASYGLPDGLALLWDVAKPPGDGGTMDYNTQNVTRSYHQEFFLMKVPLKDYGIVSSLTENDMVNDLASDVGETAFDHHNYASISATGVAVDGVIIYPSYNNALHVAQADAELSAHGMHAGRGLGVHYHADAHSATEEGLNLYNWHDYDGHSHPPIISMGFDGVAGYGVYMSGDTTSDGVSIALDDFGGHSHGDYGYHYHSQRQDDITENGSISFTKHLLPPYGAWAGKINDIPEFWGGTAPNYVGGNSTYLGTQ